MTGRSWFTWAVAATVTIASSTLALAAEVRLQGGGATFPAPLYKRLVAEYQALHPEVKIDYQSIGSGGGIKGFTDKTFDFAGSDAPMNKKEIEAAGGADNIVQVPACAGGVVPAYNLDLPGVSQPLNFTGAVLADIYMGKITKWNDEKIAALNPGVTLPYLSITPAYRTDGSGTTFVWTNYLATQSEDFKGTIGASKQVQWPVGQGGKGNEGVTAVVSGTPGSIGYIEQGYADANKVPYGMVQNKDGMMVKASPQAVSLAGSGAAEEMTGHLIAANIWNQSGHDAYPIASFTYLIVYQDLNNVKSLEQAQTLVNFLWWATHEGQKYAPELDYAPLAPAVQEKVSAAIKSITYKGQAITPQE